MDTRSTPNTTSLPAADLVGFYLTLLLGSLGLIAVAETLRTTLLPWAAVAEILDLLVPARPLAESTAALVAFDAASAMAEGNTTRAVALLAEHMEHTPDAWLAAMAARRDAPACERCGLPIVMMEPGPVGEALAVASGALRAGESWCCADCQEVYPAVRAEYAGPVRTTVAVANPSDVDATRAA